MKRLLVTVALCAACFLGAQSAHAAAQPVYIVDESAFLPTSQIVNALPAFQAAVSEDFARYWNIDAELVITDTPPAGAWTVHMQDDADGWYEGYHTLIGETPTAYVFARSAVGYGDTWQGVTDHEILEMLADPYINRMALGRRMWLVEVADPVELDAFNYSRPALDGSPVPLSDFVTPAWYRPHGKKPYDFRRHVKKPEWIPWGGFATYWSGSSWVQAYPS